MRHMLYVQTLHYWTDSITNSKQDFSKLKQNYYKKSEHDSYKTWTASL
jgi:hypothetical protein